jgi:hypothetical protein
MTGDRFLTLLREAIAPLEIAKMDAPSSKLRITLSNGRVIEPRRNRIHAADEDGLRAYVTELVG